MPVDFNPYLECFGIPAAEQPPNYYRLLGVAQFEENATVIIAAAARRSADVKLHQRGIHAAAIRDLMREVNVAKECLCDPQQKADYDSRLRAQMAAPPARESGSNLAGGADFKLGSSPVPSRAAQTISPPAFAPPVSSSPAQETMPIRPLPRAAVVTAVPTAKAVASQVTGQPSGDGDSSPKLSTRTRSGRARSASNSSLAIWLAVGGLAGIVVIGSFILAASGGLETASLEDEVESEEVDLDTIDPLRLDQVKVPEVKKLTPDSAAPPANKELPSKPATDETEAPAEIPQGDDEAVDGEEGFGQLGEAEDISDDKILDLPPSEPAPTPPAAEGEQQPTEDQAVTAKPEPAAEPVEPVRPPSVFAQLPSASALPVLAELSEEGIHEEDEVELLELPLQAPNKLLLAFLGVSEENPFKISKPAEKNGKIEWNAYYETADASPMPFGRFRYFDGKLHYAWVYGVRKIDRKPLQNQLLKLTYEFDQGFVALRRAIPASPLRLQIDKSPEPCSQRIVIQQLPAVESLRAQITRVDGCPNCRLVPGNELSASLPVQIIAGNNSLAVHVYCGVPSVNVVKLSALPYLPNATSKTPLKRGSASDSVRNTFDSISNNGVVHFRITAEIAGHEVVLADSDLPNQ